MWGLSKRKRHQVPDIEGRPNVIFDFDGTIANTLPVAITIIEKWALMDQPLTIKRIEELRGMTAQQVIKTSGIPLRRIPALLVQGRKALMKELHKAKPINGIPEVITKLSTKCNLYVMSSNSTENIEALLTSYKLKSYFTNIYGGVSIFGKTKMLKHIIQSEHLKKESCVYVGDETRDIEAAHRIKLPIISVAWGYNNEHILKQYQPEHIVHKPQDLLKLIT